MDNFWQHLDRPAFSLAPMEDVTDTVFREIVLGMTAPGKLHVVFTDFGQFTVTIHKIRSLVIKSRLNSK